MLRLAAVSRSVLPLRAVAALVLVAASPARARADADAHTAPPVREAASRVVDFRPMDDGPKPPPPPPKPDLPYQPLNPDNFRGTPPANNPHDAEVATGIGVNHDSKSTTKRPDGKYESVPEGLTYESIVDEGQSWWKDKSNDTPEKKEKNKKLLDHEQGHFDLTETEARKRNEKKKEALDKLKGTGDTPAEAEADLEKKLEEHTKEVNDDLNTKQQTYDTETDHSKNEQKQQEWTDKLQKALKEGQKPTGTQVESKSSHSVHYDAATKRLSFTDDVFTRLLDEHGKPLPGDDALLGAELLMPTFLHVGETVGGDPFFLREGAGQMSATEGGTTYFALDLPYLLYYDGMFVGLSPSAPPVGSGGSAFLAAMRAAFDGGDPFLVGLRIIPDQDFEDATQGFDGSASSPFTNGFGRVTSTPEPASVGLMAAGVALLAGWRARARRRDRSAR